MMNGYKYLEEQKPKKHALDHQGHRKTGSERSSTEWRTGAEAAEELRRQEREPSKHESASGTI
jgi:hypothetical protein